MSKKELWEIINRQATQLKKCDEIISRSEAENALLRRRVDLLVRKAFGPSSEELDPAQLEMFLQGGENSPGKPIASSALEEADPVLWRYQRELEPMPAKTHRLSRCSH